MEEIGNGSAGSSLHLEANKALAVEWLTALFGGDGERFGQLTDPGFRSVIIGDLTLCRERDLQEFTRFLSDLRTLEFEPGREFSFRLGAITAEADRVCIEAESRIMLRTGELYNNYYVLTIRVRGGYVVEMKEFGDTLHQQRLFQSDQFVGEPVIRTNLLFGEPSHTISGRM